MNIHDEPSAFAATSENLRNILFIYENSNDTGPLNRKNRVTRLSSLDTRQALVYDSRESQFALVVQLLTIMSCRVTAPLLRGRTDVYIKFLVPAKKTPATNNHCPRHNNHKNYEYSP